jgi:twitching motility protein PilJ
MNSPSLPKMYGVRLLPVLMGAALVSLLAAAGLLFFAGSPAPSVTAPAGVTRLAVVSQKMPLLAQEALRGDAKAFTQLDSSRKQLQSALENAREAGLELAADPSWQQLIDRSATVLENRAAATTARDVAALIREQMPKLLAELGNLSGAMGGDRIATLGQHLERFELNAQSIVQNLDALAGGARDAAATAQRVADSTDFIGQVLGGFAGEDAGLGVPRATGKEAEQRLGVVRALFVPMNDRIREAVSAAPALIASQTAATEMAAAAGKAGASLPAEASPGVASASFMGHTLPLVLVAFGLVLLAAVALIYMFSGNIRRAAEAQAKLNERNQDAILRLLDELSSLADGDLTVQATVTEDITGAIADSINYAIEALRELVTTINDSAIQLDSAAKQSQALSAHLAKASGAQSKQIASATESIGAMASSTEEVSGNAERASDVARHSVDVAHKGGDAVRRTIDGMNAIRETIQETSKRIKRLGESSQEIGNIVELINDIAEQTNILALNASIQASMAGDAGRGFAVVADEVQRLAERAANATKQIEVLVRTIQTDTNEAVVSMERSTTDVVGGALLAENAGAALEEIEQVSNQIASLVQNISASSRGQASAAGNIARNMQVLREISSQTADSTSATSAAIGKLAELSAGLRKSVSGFRLPNYVPPQVTPVKAEPPRPAAPATPAPVPEAHPPGRAGGEAVRKVSKPAS